MYISRELDQALWVYGHATKNGHTMNTYHRRSVLLKKDHSLHMPIFDTIINYRKCKNRLLRGKSEGASDGLISIFEPYLIT